MRRTGRGRAKVGKLSSDELRRAVLSTLPGAGGPLLVPPTPGVDVGVLARGSSQVLVLTTDPVYVEPALGFEDAAWFAFHILASDLTTSGRAPSFLTVDLHWPVDAPPGALRTFMRVWSAEARRLGTAIVTGHTGRYEGCRFPVVGGSTFGATAPREGYVTSAMARPGQVLLVSKSVGLETATLLAALFPEESDREVGSSLRRRLRGRVRELSTVDEALLAAEEGIRGRGVWAMHDATEGGLRLALQEMGAASRRRLEVDLSELPLLPEVASMADAFGFDPLASSSEGTLLVACHPSAEEGILGSWRRRGIRGTRIGRVRSGAPGVWERGRRLPPAPPDGFWPAVERTRRRR